MVAGCIPDIAFKDEFAASTASAQGTSTSGSTSSSSPGSGGASSGSGGASSGSGGASSGSGGASSGSGGASSGSGGASSDADGDGYTAAEGDCDEANAAVHPFGGDTFGDGVDTDCDGGDYDAVSAKSGAYYVLVPEWVDATKAAARCVELGYDRLAEILSSDEQYAESHLPSVAYLSKYGNSQDYFGGGKRLWVGLSKGVTGYQWPSGKAVGYMAWFPNEPNGGDACVEGDAAGTSGGVEYPNGGWNDIACSQAMPFVCEQRKQAKVTNVVYAAGAAAALAKSYDLGATWIAVTATGVTGDFKKLTGAQGRLVASVTGGALFTSSDEGATWSPCTGLNGLPELNWALPRALTHLGGRWFLGGNAQIFTSEDGVAWTPRFSSGSMKDGYGKPASFASFARIGNNVVASTGHEGTTYLVRSSDGGTTWGAPELMNATLMPGIGTNCAHHWVAAAGTAWLAFAGSFCDNIVYNPAKVWVNPQANASGNWTPITPVGHYTVESAYGNAAGGSTLAIGGSGQNRCKTAVFFDSDGNLVKASALPEASFENGCTGWLENVGGTWFARAGSSVARSSDDGATWAFSKPGFVASALAVTESLSNP